MINPNICKRIRVDVQSDGVTCVYRYGRHETKLELLRGTKLPGSRYVYLKFSICTDSYYVTARP